MAVALPVLPALAHAATLRWAAADLDERHSFGGFGEVSDMLRSISVWLVGFAVVLGLVAVLKPGLARLLGTFLLYGSLVVQFLWLAAQAFIFWEDRTDSDSVGETGLGIAVTQLGTALLFLAASLVAVAALRRSHAGRTGGTTGRADPAPTSSSGPAVA
jgi:hypothetical protein